MTNTSLIEARMKANLSQQELANLVDITQHAISQYETGKRKPATHKAIKIARILNSDVETLFG